MNSLLKYKKADSKDAEYLTIQAFRSKQSWGYSDDLMELWKEDLIITEEFIKANEVVMVYDQSVYIGFYGLKYNDQYGCYELDHCWIEPFQIGKGYGKQIFRKIVDDLKQLNQNRIVLISDPNANGFYEHLGCYVIGKFKSKVSGRELNIYQNDF